MSRNYTWTRFDVPLEVVEVAGAYGGFMEPEEGGTLTLYEGYREVGTWTFEGSGWKRRLAAKAQAWMEGA